VSTPVENSPTSPVEKSPMQKYFLRDPVTSFWPNTGGLQEPMKKGDRERQNERAGDSDR